MFAHIIDSMAERGRFRQEQPLLAQNYQISSQEALNLAQDQNPEQDSLKGGRIVGSRPQDPQQVTNSMKTIIHENIEKAIHPHQERSPPHPYEANYWDAEIKRLSLGVSSSQLETHHDSTFAERLFAVFITNVGYPLSLNSFSTSCEKTTPATYL